MTEITLPRLIGTREAARSLVDAAGIHGGEHEVILFARAVASAAPSFVDEFVRCLSAAGVDTVRVVGSSESLLNSLSESASRIGHVSVSRTSSRDLANA